MVRIPCSISLAVAPGLAKPPQRVAFTAVVSRRMQSMSTLTPTASSSRPTTYSNQYKLPRLPVPDLEKTLDAYVKSLVPLLEQKYTGSTLQKEIEKRKIFARDFAASGGLGRALQERLKDLDHVSPHNWLDDTLWLNLAYHTWRAPLLVNSDWWMLFKADPNDRAPASYGSSSEYIPPEGFPAQDVPANSMEGGQTWIDANPTPERLVSYDEATTKEGITAWQAKKAAWLARRFGEYRLMLQRGEVAPESTKAGPMCMAQYEKLFNFARIPLPGSDAFSAIAPHALHTTLLIDDFYYEIDTFAPAAEGAHPEPLQAAEIERRFKAAVADVKARQSKGENPPLVGLLSGDDRDTWTVNRERLIALSPKNRETLNSLSTSLIAISLDPYTLPSLASEDPLRQPAVDAHLHNAATGIQGGRNRWFDKAISIMLETSGRTSLLGEHSPVDALIPSYAVDYVLSSFIEDSPSKGSSEALPKEGEGWKRLEWVVDDAMLREIDACQERNKAIIEDSDNSQLYWGEFATEWIKQNAKVSPDSFIQQALQLAWYRDQGYVTATYETAGTRAFLHGRTETVRTVTSESRDFVKAMLDDKAPDSKRYDLLTKACTVHNSLTKTSSSGHGIDRYFMGLKTQLRGTETHALFEDEFYAKSQEWKLSTSAFSPGKNFLGIGFGAAWPDGYGINYQPGPHLIKFGIESKFSCPVTSTARFKHHLAQALRDMRRVCESSAGGAVSSDKSKL